MSPRAQIVALIGALLLLALIFELVRRLKLRVGYSLLWLLVGILAFVLVLFPGVVRFIDHIVGIQSPTSLLFTAGILFALLLLLHHSLTLTTLWGQDKNLAQDHALLERRVRQLESRLANDDALSAESSLSEVSSETVDAGQEKEDAGDDTVRS